MERLIGAARESLTPLKCLLILALVANFATPFLWWDWHPGNIEPRHAMRMLLFVYAIATLMLDSLPGGRIVNTINRALTVCCVGGILWMKFFKGWLQQLADGESEPTVAVALIIPIATMLAGAFAYVAAARPSPDRSGRYWGLLYTETYTSSLLHRTIVGRLIWTGREYLTPLKWVLVKWVLNLGILACSFPAFHMLIQEDSTSQGDAFTLTTCIAIAAFMLDWLPGDRTVDTTTRALAAVITVGMFVVGLTNDFPWSPYPKTFIAPFVVASVGAVFYVASVRTAPEVTSPPPRTASEKG